MKKIISSLIRKFKWNLEAIELSNNISPTINANILPNGKKIILVPHSDDEWIGCSRIISLDKNTIILNMDMPGGDGKEIHKLRYEELSNTTSKYNVKLKTVVGDKVRYIYDLLVKEKPRYVCVPYFLDWHNDHIEVMNYLKEALIGFDRIDIIMYQVSVPMKIDTITHYLPLSKKEWKNKWHFFSKNYRTQINFPKDRFAINEKINGKYVGEFATEVYSILSVSEWKKILEDGLLNEKNKQILKHNLHSIKNIRKIVNDIRFNER